MRCPVTPITSASSLASLALVLWACNPAGLDHLQNGQHRDAAVTDERVAETPSRDSSWVDLSSLRPEAVDERDLVGILDAGQPIGGDSLDGAGWIDGSLDTEGGEPGRDQVDAENDVAQSADGDEAETPREVSEGGGVTGSGGAVGSGGVTGSGGVVGSGGVTGSGGMGSGGATARHPDADLDSFDPPADTREPPLKCGGVADSQLCWYLGKAGDSCATFCATHGGTSPQAASHVGNASQGGSSQECSRLLSLLGMSGSVITTTAEEGVGCAVALGLHWYITSPAYSDNARIASVQLVCGCLR